MQLHCHVKPSGKVCRFSEWEKRDPEGVPLFQELIERAKEGGGYTPYLWPRAGAEEPIAKLSYSLFEGCARLAGAGSQEWGETICKITYSSGWMSKNVNAVL